MQLGAWLVAMVGPLAARLLTVLGFQVVTITGLTASISALKTVFLTHLGAVPAAGLQLALLGGVGEGLGIIFGAIAARLVLWHIQNASRILGVAS